VTKFVALLRGINVGGKNILPMEELRELLAKLGCGDVATYIQSGNAVFRYKGNAAELPDLIATAIDSRFGFRPSVMVLTAGEFDAVAKASPFAAEASELKFLHVWFVREPATSANTTRMRELESGGEKFLLTGSAVYLYAPDGIGRSKLAGGMEKCLGVPATARNWRTVCKIGEMVSGPGQA
jgi:uncharacterized protein (DUF1697 family)